MTAQEREHIKQHLIVGQNHLKDKIVDLKELTQPIVPDCVIGRISRMDAINNKSVNEAALRQATEKLREIEFALENIDQPDFGKCRNCGSDIPPGRLLVIPESSLCVRCASH